MLSITPAKLVVVIQPTNLIGRLERVDETVSSQMKTFDLEM